VSIKLDAGLLKKLSSMTLRARYVAEGFISGLHQSPFKGASLEFAQHRQYVPPDELKYLDWKVFAKTDRYYIKQFQEETNLKGYSIIDTSRSMGYSSAGVTKLEYAKYLSAAITYLMIKQRDSAGLITYSDVMKEFIPARNFRAHMQYVLDKLEVLEPSGITDFERSFADVGKKIKKRSLLMLFSDLLEDPEKLIRTLKFFPYLKNDLVVFHILDPEEIELKQKGLIEYIDLETGAKLRTRPEVIRKEYRKNMRDFLKNIERGLRSHSIEYHRITTDTTLDQAVTGFIQARKRIHL
jgi:uncharacterized protein (DUF58 family)